MTSTLATFLDTIPTTDPTLPTDHFQAWSNRSVIPEWTSAVNLYAAVEELGDESHLQRILSCRKEAWFVQNSETLEIRVASKHCNLRWCPLCSESRQFFITTQTTDWLKSCHHPKLLTLTLRHTSSPLKHQIQFLYESFRQLRKKSYFKKNVTGGIWFFQVKISKTDGNWHPHLHCTIDGNYLTFNKIQKLWIRITKGSKFLNIKPCTDIERSAKHIARYAARPADLADLEFDQGLELYYALKSKRLVGSWGTARSLSFRPTKPPDAHLWKNIGSWTSVQAMRGIQQEADLIWKAFITNTPASQILSLTYSDYSLGDWGKAANPCPPVTEYLDFYNRGG
ncbi:hypothetical protein ES703_67873 [subsurface metagenome]